MNFHNDKVSLLDFFFLFDLSSYFYLILLPKQHSGRVNHGSLCSDSTVQPEIFATCSDIKIVDAQGNAAAGSSPAANPPTQPSGAPETTSNTNSISINPVSLSSGPDNSESTGPGAAPAGGPAQNPSAQIHGAAGVGSSSQTKTGSKFGLGKSAANLSFLAVNVVFSALGLKVIGNHYSHYR